MSVEDRKRYEKDVASRMTEIDAIMADNSLTFAQKKEMVAKINREMSAVITDLNEEALVTEEELEDLQHEMEIEAQGTLGFRFSAKNMCTKKEENKLN